MRERVGVMWSVLRADRVGESVRNHPPRRGPDARAQSQEPGGCDGRDPRLIFWSRTKRVLASRKRGKTGRWRPILIEY